MGPWIMMAMQLLADQKKKEQDREGEVYKLRAQQARDLGAFGAPLEAAAFKYGQDNTPVNYGAALSMLGRGGKKTASNGGGDEGNSAIGTEGATDAYRDRPLYEQQADWVGLSPEDDPSFGKGGSLGGGGGGVGGSQPAELPRLQDSRLYGKEPDADGDLMEPDAWKWQRLGDEVDGMDPWYRKRGKDGKMHENNDVLDPWG